MKSIVLAEKPSVGKELARVLGCQPKSKSFCEGKDYIVTWAMGHLVEPADPEDYDEKWKAWKMEYLPMLPDKLKLHVIRKTSFQFNVIKNIFARPDVDNLIIATDAGREGELVARWIMKLGGWKKSFQRLWISSQTDSAIKDGFKNLKPGSSYDNLFHAAECRSEADWIIGLNVTRALVCKYDAKLSAGRVQTPTLALIIDREKEIQSFVPEPFWTISADFGDFTAFWHGKNGSGRIKNHEIAKNIADKIAGKEGVITDVNIEEKSELPPLAYDLTLLQRDANRILNFSAKKTLQVLQGLYERHKIVTYPRTDSNHITADMLPTLKSRLKAIENTKYGRYVVELMKSEINPGKRFVDNSKVSDHHAIIPTEERVNLDRLDFDERALWDLIAKRFIAVLSKPFRFKNITVKIEVDNEIFAAQGRQTVDQGWKAVTGNENNDTDSEETPLQNLTKQKKCDKLNVKKVNIPQSFTKPPPRYTEGTLLEAMENAGRFIESKELKASIERGGLGTPATRADIIEKLFANFYIEKKGKELVPTAQGFELIEIVPHELRSPELTAQWEVRLGQIAKGFEKSGDFVKGIRVNALNLVEAVKTSSIQYKPRSESKVKCPMCGKLLLAVRDQKGNKLLVCRSRSCGHEQSDGDFNDLSRKPSLREKQNTRRLMNQFGNTGESESFTLGDLLKSKEKNK